MRYQPMSERFSVKYSVDTQTECWEWTGSTVIGGYGMLRGERGAPSKLAHRFAYEHFVGPIPSGMRVLHKCDNPPCVNPDHLFLGTHEENMRDMQRKGRARVLDATDVLGARLLLSSGKTQAEVAKEIGVDRATLQRALKNAQLGDYGPGVAISEFSTRYTKIDAEKHPVILKLCNEGVSISEIARRFNCDRKTIRNIRDLGPKVA